VAGGLFLVPVMLAVEGLPPALTATNAAGFLWLATAGTAGAYALWFRGIERLPIARITLLGLLSPVVAALAGWAALGQTLGAWQLAGMALVLGAVWLGQTVRRATRRSKSGARGDQDRHRRVPAMAST
jgi:probable blue pigment (indigoidine) exporter